MEKIEHINPLTRKEKMLLRLKNFLRIKTVAYTVSAAAGFGAGTAVQNVERGITGYDPVAHEAIKNKNKQSPTDDYGKYKQEKEAAERKDVLEWGKGIFAKVKQGILNPKEFIENTETYRSLYLKYLSTLKFIDDASFIVPALLMFIMLGGFMSRKLTELNGDPVDKEQNRQLIAKINELVDHANNTVGAIKEIDQVAFSPEQLAGIKQMLQDAAEALPSPDTLK